MNITEKIQKETENVKIEVKDIPSQEWGGPLEGVEYYKNLYISFGDDLLHIILSYTESLADEFCKEINAMWGDDRQPFYHIDLTGFWMEFPKDWMDEGLEEYDEVTLKEIKEIAIKYYLLAKYDKPSYIRRGFNIHEYLGDD